MTDQKPTQNSPAPTPPVTVPLATYVPPQVNSTLPHEGDQVPPRIVTELQVGKYKVEVIREKCIGAASCVAIAPNVFALDEEEIAIILQQNGDDDETILLSAQSCPTAAIIVTDTSTGEQVWPRE